MGSVARKLIPMVTPKAKHLEAREAMQRRDTAARSLARRKVRDEFRKGIESTELMRCEPQGEQSKRLNSHLGNLEPRLRDLAIPEPDTNAIVGETDKGRQNAMNKLAGMAGGDQIIQAYWDKLGLAVSAVSRANGCERIGVHLIRVAPRSDEGVLLIAGRRLGEHTKLEFEEALKLADRQIDLSRYTYTLDIPTKEGVRRFSLDLEAFSRVLKYGKDMVTSCNYVLSDPITIHPDGRAGFIQEEIKRIENGEVRFYGHLPVSFQGIGSLAEVRSPFTTNLSDSGIVSLSSGAFVEIKLRMRGSDAEGLLPFTEDGWGLPLGMEGSIGTRKGFAEIFSGEIGMRGLNTFIGKARANRVLSAITHAMADLAGTGLDSVIPITGGYLSYWVDMSASHQTAETIKETIAGRIRSAERNGIDLDLSFEPAVRIMDASGMDISDVRARFILGSLGKGLYPAGVLERTDFLINFIENVRPAVQMDIYQAMAEEGSPALHDLDNINLIKRVCSKRAGGRRTIRDTEDLVWVLRNDDKLPAEIKSRKGDLERWLFDFSWEKAARMFLLLTERVQAESERIRKRERRPLLKAV